MSIQPYETAQRKQLKFERSVLGKLMEALKKSVQNYFGTVQTLNFHFRKCHYRRML